MNDLLELERVSFSYDSSPLLQDISFGVKEGEIFIVAGQCGHGKSTLLKICAGLLKPKSGTVRLMGSFLNEIPEIKLRELRLELGYVFQNAALIFNLNIFENIALPLRYHKRLDEETIRRLVAARLELVKILGYEKRFPAELSMGIRKHAAIARALALSPRLILMDEPTSGLDPINSKSVAELIVALKKEYGVSTIMVTHDIHYAFPIADRIGILNEQQLLAVDLPQRLLKSENAFVRNFLSGLAVSPGFSKTKG